MNYTRITLFAVFVLGAGIAPASGQVITYPHVQNFDLVIAPALPSGWTSSQNRTPGTNDFTTTTSTPRSLPNAVLSTNATVGQELRSPSFDFSSYHPDSMRFHTRRSGTHNAPIVVEASLNNGATYPILIGDTVVATGSTNYVLTSLVLPEILAGNNAVRFRWRILADATGTTGTFRIDDLTITATAAHDLAVHAVRTVPEYPAEGDSITALVVVRNAGRGEAPGFIVRLFHDMNKDSIPQPAELLGAGESTGPLAVTDSQRIALPLTITDAGNYPLIALVEYPPDVNPVNNTLHVGLAVGYRAGSVVVNEIMYAPTGTEPEWVELYNTRDDSVNLRNWLVSDNVVTTRRLITGADIRIPPAGYVVLTRDSSALVNMHPNMPARIIRIPNFPTLNNTGDAVVLYDNRNATTDSVAYLPSWGGNSEGRSLERRDPLGSSILQQNWGSSHGSTPGRRNSLTRKDLDISVDSLGTYPQLPVNTDPITVSIQVRNRGTQPTSAAILSLYLDANMDSLPQPSELLGSTVLSPLDPLDSSVTIMSASQQPAGSHYFIAVLAMEGDEDTLNNIRGKQIVVGHPAGALRVNEIMYAPTAGIPEWVECVNTSAETVDVKRWRIGNRLTTSRYAITSNVLKIPPGGLFVVTKDTALLGNAYPHVLGTAVQTTALPTFLWNNGGDAVVLMDNRSVVMDSVHYRNTWGGTNGFSLERIDPEGDSNDSLNWSSSVDTARATPGQPNSQVIVNHDLRITAVRTEPAFPGEHAGVFVTVQNTGRHVSSPYVAALYHDRNGDSIAAVDERVAQTAYGAGLAFRETTEVGILWENPPPGGHRCIVVVEYPPDERTANNIRHKTVTVSFVPHTIVVNEIMYAPVSGQAEYVELVNAGQSEVDLAGWRISDHPTPSGSVTQVQLGSSRRIIPPGGFFTIAADSTILTFYPHLLEQSPEHMHIASRSSGLGLNNDGDAVILRDLTGAAVDSVYYRPSWHNPGVADRTGRSLERISPRLPSNDPRNWTTCTRPSGGTPGMANSVFTHFLPSTATLSFTPNPFSPDGDGRDDNTIIQHSIPLQVSMLRVRIYDVRGRLIRHLVNNEPGGSTGQVVWDGLDDDGQKARIGMYVVLLEAMDEQGGIIETARGVVVLAAKL